MLKTLSRPASVRRPALAPVDATFEDSSPFGLQGLRRDPLQLLKTDAIGRLASTLALTVGRRDIRNPVLATDILAEHPEWVDKYQTVHLIEKSLWINGRSDLVMTLTPDPSQIPDSPPQAILDTLSRAYVTHPDATIWYGVPLFGDDKTPDGLPIPLTAQQVRDEQARRIRTAQTHALRYGWLYKAAAAGITAAKLMLRLIAGTWHFGAGILKSVRRSWKSAKRDQRRRQRAMLHRELELSRHGWACTEIPEHTTSLGKAASQAWEMAVLANQHLSLPLGVLSTSLAGVSIGHALLFVPLTVVSADPFLFLELPEEPGKLRHLAHWYWQDLSKGRHKLHLHV